MTTFKELMCAIEAEDLARVRQAVAKGAILTQRDKRGLAPLCLAVIYDQLDIVRELCTAESINFTDSRGGTALERAVFVYKPEFVNVLLAQEGVDVNMAEVGADITPLYMAAERGYIDIVKMLLKMRDIDVNLATYSGKTPLHVATQCGHLDVVNALLGAGADGNKVDVFGYTPLYSVAQRGQERCDVLRLLLRHGANPNEQKNNLTPLYYSALYGFLATTRQLIVAGANLYSLDKPHKLIVEVVLKKRSGMFWRLKTKVIDVAVLLYVALDNRHLSMQSIQRLEDEVRKKKMFRILRNKLNNDELVTTTKKQLNDAKIEWIMHDSRGQNRIVDVVMAMKPLRLPTLVILEMLMFDNPRLTEVPMHIVWGLIEKVAPKTISKKD